MNELSPYAPAPNCAHDIVVERTCDYQPPNYLDAEGRVGCVVVVRLQEFECADCGAEVSPRHPHTRPVERRPRCTRPACDCFTAEEWALLRARPYWGDQPIPPERVP